MAASVASVSAKATASGTSLVIDKPSDVVSGNLMVMQVVTDRTAGSGAASTGWTQIQQTDHTDDTNGGGEMVTFYKVAGGSEPSTYTVTFTDAGESVGYIAKVTGNPSTGFLTTSSEAQNDSTSTTATGGTVTPNTTDSLILFFVGGNRSGTTVTTSAYSIATSNPTWTEQWDSNQSGPFAAMASATRPELTATGAASATLSSSQKSLVHMVVIGGQVDISPSVLSVASSVIDPALDLTTVVSADTVSVTTSVQAPTVSMPTPDWTNENKNIATCINQDKS